MSRADSRAPTRSEVERWLTAASGLGARGWSVDEPIGDVSTRRYYRARAPEGDTVVVAWYPADADDAYRAYQASTGLLTVAGIPTARILASDQARRFMALEDAGDTRLFDLDPEDPRTADLFAVAADLAARIAGLAPTAVAALNPPLGRGLFERELEQTWRLFLDLRLDPPLARRLRDGLEALCSELDAAPRVPCHRDFMARNLMVRDAPAEQALVVLDHQDLRLGPRGYDLASLFHDSCRLEPTARRRLELRAGADCAGALYHRLVVQRMLKIVGTFHAFARRGAPQYLPMVDRALDHALEHLAALPETAALVDPLREAWGRRRA